jgi:hypothetical protein
MAAVGVLGVLTAGCGGGGGSTTTAEAESQQVRATGFLFSAPADWRVALAGRNVTVRPASGPTLASVNTYPLLKRYRTALFGRVRRELDAKTAQLATGLRGRVTARRTVVVAGQRAHQYDIEVPGAESRLTERITYVFRGKTEYYLLCRWPTDEPEPGACAQLTSSFRVR